MGKNTVSGIILTLLMLSVLTLAFNIQPVKSDWTWTETIYVRADGSVDPPTAPISTVDNITYILTDNIVGDVPGQSSAIAIERDDIVLNGAGYIVQGTWTSYSKGISLSGRSNVTTKNMHVKKFYYGIYLYRSTNCRIENVTATNNSYGIALPWGSNQNILSHNNATNNSYGIYIRNSNNNNITSNTITYGTLRGIRLWDASNNILFSNIVSSSKYGIELWTAGSYGNILSSNVVSSSRVDGVVLNGADNNTLSGNIVSSNKQYGITLMADNNIVYGNTIVNNSGYSWSSGIYFGWTRNNIISSNTIKNNRRGIFLYGEGENNKIFHNNFISNTDQVASSKEHSNIWDDGYPSGGNYWSDHVTVDDYSGVNQNELGSDGIVDEPYVIDANNRDNYPLVKPWSPVISATIDVDPDILNLRSRGKWITAYVQLPEGYNAQDIEATTILLNGTISPVLDPKYEFVTNSSEYLADHNQDGILERMVKFDKAEVTALLSVGEATLTITGEVNGTEFEGSDSIRVISPSTHSGGCKGFKK